MRRTIALTAVSAAALFAYLLFWPVPVDPVAWNAPTDAGLTGPFAENTGLQGARALDLGDYVGPEHMALGADGELYASTQGGAIIRIKPSGEIEEYVDPGGRVLGIEASPDGRLLLANAFLGLQAVDASGQIIALLTEFDGKPLTYVNNLAVGSDGTIYFSQSSNKFSPNSHGGTYSASLLDVMEHGGHGRVFAYDAANRTARIIIDDVNFANGVAISDDDSFLLVAETGAYRILRHWLHGPRRGQTDILIDNLPGFPDNINSGLQGRFWVGLVAPRSEALDRLSAQPFLRKVVQRLPAFLRPQAQPSSHVFALDKDGNIVSDLQDPQHRFPALTGVLETTESLFLTSLFGSEIGVLTKEPY